jgi:hypothetical protein
MLALEGMMNAQRNRGMYLRVGENARSIMSDEFDSLNVTERAAAEVALIRCRVLAAKIANELRNKRPEHFVDGSGLAELYASLEYAAGVLARPPLSTDDIN